MLTARELIEQYNSGIRDFRGVILQPEENLSYAILKNADFRQASFTRVDLTGADLSSSNFSDGACFSLSNLSNVNLTAANLTGANLETSSLQHIILDCAVFSQDTRFPQGFNPFEVSQLNRDEQTSQTIPSTTLNSQAPDADATLNALFQRSKIYLDEVLATQMKSTLVVIKTLKADLISSQKRISQLEEAFDGFKQSVESTSKALRISPVTLPDSSQKEGRPQVSPDLVLSYCDHLRNLYHTDIRKLRKRAVGVSLTQESFKHLSRKKSDARIILSRASPPYYWIFDDQADNVWLFPKEGWSPSLGSLQTLKALFDIKGDPSDKFNVVKPATVVEMGEDWHLCERGELEFRY